MFRTFLVLIVALQIACCPIECCIGACPACCSPPVQLGSAELSYSCCCEKTAAIKRQQAAATPSTDSQSTDQKPSPDHSVPSKKSNCICNGALKPDDCSIKSDAQAWDLLTAIVFIDDENRGLDRGLGYSIEWADTGQTRSGRETRLWISSLIC